MKDTRQRDKKICKEDVIPDYCNWCIFYSEDVSKECELFFRFSHLPSTDYPFLRKLCNLNKKEGINNYSHTKKGHLYFLLQNFSPSKGKITGGNQPDYITSADYIDFSMQKNLAPPSIQKIEMSSFINNSNIIYKMIRNAYFLFFLQKKKIENNPSTIWMQCFTWIWMFPVLYFSHIFSVTKQTEMK